MSEHSAFQAHNGLHGSSGAQPRPGAIAIATNWLGAVVSICLVIGLGVWGYRLAVRDVREVPVVRALDGAMRVQPDEPGGQTAAHQGLAVNSVQSDGTVEGAANEVVLAPAPVGLSDEDLALVTAAPKDGTNDLSSEASNLTDISATVQAAIDAETAQTAGGASQAAHLDGLPGVKRSPRPRARVASLAGVQVSTDNTTAVGVGATGEIDADPASILAGTRLVQLGAFDDRASAEKEWGHIVARHGDLIGSRQRLILLAESGGRNFFRLRVVGFENLSDSRRLCSALVARGTPCIPVTAR